MSYYDHLDNRNTNALDRVLAAAKRRPEALLLLAAGCALLMSKNAKSLSLDTQSLRRKARGTQAYVSDLASQAYEQASSAVEPARDYANRVSSYVSDAGSTAMTQASELAQQARTKARSNLEHYIQEQPIAVGLVGLAIGAAIGAALPETDVENRTLGTQRDLLASKAQDLAETQIQQLKEAAGEFGEKIISKASGDTEKSPT
jgi:hypothetical protein